MLKECGEVGSRVLVFVELVGFGIVPACLSQSDSGIGLPSFVLLMPSPRISKPRDVLPKAEGNHALSDAPRESTLWKFSPAGLSLCHW